MYSIKNTRYLLPWWQISGIGHPVSRSTCPGQKIVSSGHSTGQKFSHFPLIIGIQTSAVSWFFQSLSHFPGHIISFCQSQSTGQKSMKIDQNQQYDKYVILVDNLATDYWSIMIRIRVLPWVYNCIFYIIFSG